MDYQPEQIERKWRSYWEKNNVYRVNNDTDKPKYYVLDMFPYPSGEGLHVGHPLGYVASDIVARYKRLCGFNVLHPMGYDAFGLPAEQYAIQTGVHPAQSTQQNIQRYRGQLDNLGFCYDWSRQVSTCEPNYYRWTQQIFLWLFGSYYNKKTDKAENIELLIATFEKEGNKNVSAATTQTEVFSAEDWNGYSPKQKDEILMNYRLAYRKKGYVNWCEELGTVLANDEVKDGVSERGGYPVIQKEMWQWTLRITAYSERLLQGLEEVDFSEALKTQQRNWIGKSEGARITFLPQGASDWEIEIFTTRPDTIFGATFMVIAPEHPLVAQITTDAQRAEIEQYLQYVGSRTERERTTEAKRVTGAFTGAYVAHPFNGKAVPVWVSEYVLIGYGTGAIMAVPSNDERDNRFARHFGLEIIPVIDQSMYPHAEMEDKVGKLQNSDFINGLEVKDAIETIIREVEKRGIGTRQINYRLRDANFSRQRYWGEPFPIIYSPDGVATPDVSLPVELPDLTDFKPTRDGQSPLARATHWHTQNGWTRELDTMPGYAGSSWYFLRYMDANNNNQAFSQEAVNYWREVDLYVGGAEHAVGHLMYSRFWHKFLFDLGKVPTHEPYRRLINQGMIQGVIETLYMLKEKRNGNSVFVSADRITEFGNEEEDFAKIPIYIGFVKNYGSPDSYLDADGIEAFKQWRSDYQSAEFELNADGHLVTHSEVGKMSKRYHNVVNPDDVVKDYGADCFRMYEMFLGPLQDSKPWNTQGIIGVSKFLRKFWSMFFDANGNNLLTDEQPNADELKVLHTAIKNVRYGLENFSLNTCVSDFMKVVNELRDLSCHKRAVLQDLVLLIAPFAPHLAEELWTEALGNQPSVHQNGVYPQHDENHLKNTSFIYPVQVGNKVRAKLSFPVDASKEQIEQAIRNDANLSTWVDGKEVQKIIVVPNRLVNIVAK